MKQKIGLIVVALTGMFISFGCSEESKKAVTGTENNVTELKARTTDVAPEVTAAPAEADAAAVATADKTAEKVVKKAAESNVASSPAVPKGGLTLKDYFNTMKLPKVVATIGDEKITKDQLLKEIEAQIPPSMQGKPLPPQAFAQLPETLPMIVDAMISRKILLGMAAAEGIKPSKEALGQQVDKFLKEMPPAQKQMLEQQLKAQGSSLEAYRKEQIEKPSSQAAAAIDQWITEKVLPSITVDDAAVEKYYRENQERFKKPETIKVAHILIAPEKPSMEKMQKMSDEEKKAFAENADKKAKAKAEEILAKVKQGGDFAKLAKENSICPSKAEGGALPEFDRTGAMPGAGGGKMDKVFTDAAYKLKVGGISDVVKTVFGYHIIKALAHNKSSYVPLDTVKGFLKKNLQDEALKKKIGTMIDSEKEKKKVKILLKGATPSTPAPAAAK